MHERESSGGSAYAGGFGSKLSRDLAGVLGFTSIVFGLCLLGEYTRLSSVTVEPPRRDVKGSG